MRSRLLQIVIFVIILMTIVAHFLSTRYIFFKDLDPYIVRCDRFLGVCKDLVHGI